MLASACKTVEVFTSPVEKDSISLIDELLTNLKNDNEEKSACIYNQRRPTKTTEEEKLENNPLPSFVSVFKNTSSPTPPQPTIETETLSFVDGRAYGQGIAKKDMNNITAKPKQGSGKNSHKRKSTNNSNNGNSEKRGRPSNFDIMGRVSVTKAQEFLKKYNRCNLILGQNKTEVFTQAEYDIVCNNELEFNYFLYVYDMRHELIQEVEKINQKFQNLDNLENELLCSKRNKLNLEQIPKELEEYKKNTLALCKFFLAIRKKNVQIDK